MKFINLESRGGNYLVVAENVAWLRTAENGQTSVGIVGGQPLLVVGTIEEVAQKILDGAGGEGVTEAAPAPQAAPEPQSPAPPTSNSGSNPESEPQPAPQPEPEPRPQPVQASAPAERAPPPSPAAPVTPKRVAAAPPRQMKKGMTLAERVAAAAAAER
jgi:hypothetical protein